MNVRKIAKKITLIQIATAKAAYDAAIGRKRPNG